jgi:hypothetical protein
MGWYAILKKARNEKEYQDLDDQYLSIGHSGYLHGKYGGNYIWSYSLEDGFMAVPEEKEQETHWEAEKNNPQFLKIRKNEVYKGRVDTVRKIASLASCGKCTKKMLEVHPLEQRRCEKIKGDVIQAITKEFGRVSIREFL